MYCPNCGTPSEAGYRFCMRCGATLPQAPSSNAASIFIVEPSWGPHPAAIPVTPSDSPAVFKPEEYPPVSTPSESQAQAAPVKKGRLWPPLLFLAIMSAVGLLVFFMTRTGIGTDPAMPWFQVENGVLTFDETRYTGGAVLTIPESIGGQRVTSLAERCFVGCGSFETVILPDTLTEIGADAFYECSRLRGIFLPAGIQQIGDGAFYGCQSLEAICIPETVTFIGVAALSHCVRLRHIFFSGFHEQWTELYDLPINPDTYVYCQDGTFPHYR